MLKKSLSLILVILLSLTFVACASDNAPSGSDNRSWSDADSSGISSSDATSSDTNQGSDDSDAYGPLLYKITDQNGNYCYLFGSVHVGEDWMYPLPEYILDAFNESNYLAVEMNISKYENDIAFSQEMMMAYVYTDGTTIQDHISSDLYLAASKILNDNGYGYKNSLLSNFMPSFWEQLISEILYKKMGVDFEKGIDRHLIKLAEESGKEIFDVEDAMEHSTFPAKFSAELQEYLLEMAVETINDSKIYEETLNDTKQLLELWASGNEQEICEFLREEEEFEDDNEKRFYEEYNHAMMTKRDLIMADFITDALSDGDKAFVTVGTAHIVGDDSVTGILRSKGYTVEIINNSVNLSIAA